MFVLVIGGGPTGAQLASRLGASKCRVRLVEHRRDMLAHLHRELPSEVIYEGNPLDEQVLETAGIRQAQVLAACTSSDTDNLVLCFLARSRYGVPRTIAQINQSHNAWLFDARFHVDVALDPAEILSSLIAEEMSLGEMMTLLKLRRGQYALVEQQIPAGAKAVGVALKDLDLPEKCLIAVIIRRGEVVLPRGATVLEAGDEVLAVIESQAAEQLAALFAAPS